jgi:hypothetical protein
MTMQAPEFIQNAVGFLVAAEVDGQWQDYELPVGISTEWATAYIGWALAEVADCWHLPKADESARRAARWLTDQRTYPVGWGYNATTGADTDSTACAIALFDTLGISVSHEDRALVRNAWQDLSGFATFPQGPGAWSEPHLDILWPALRGAHLEKIEHLWQGLQPKLHASFNDSKGWHGYWWQDSWYCTFHVLLAYRWLNKQPRRRLTPPAGPVQTNSYSGAAWIAGSLLLSGHIDAGRELFRQITTYQRADGSWDSALDLRVTNPEISVPDERPESGQVYGDQNRLMTTASIIRALCTEPD